MLNPFFFGKPVSERNFIGRRRELKRIIGRISKGECTAIIGDPHIGKSSLLGYIEQNEIKNFPQNKQGEQWHANYVDTQLLGTEFTPSQFWEHSLTPIKDQIEKNIAPQSIQDHYILCEKNHFGNITLERFFNQLKKENHHFVLFLDEFDVLLNHPVLNSAEFYGGLRALASRNGDAFAIIIASRSSLSHLNLITQEFNPTGSPFFNIFSEVELGSMTSKEVEQLLSLGDNRFTRGDKETIKMIGGKHPFLLQATAAAMWDAYDEENLEDPLKRTHYVTKRVYRELDLFFNESWRVWSPEFRKAFTCVGIAHQSFVLNVNFRMSLVINDLKGFAPELSDLEERGLITKTQENECGYCIEPEIMLTWLADELIKVGRSEKPFETWLQTKQLDGAFLRV